MTANLEMSSYASHDDYSTVPRDSGDFLSRRHNPVKATELVYKDETADATIREHNIRMLDGTQYKVSDIQPKHQTTDATYLRTPAWTTSHNKGYEREYALSMAKLGVAVLSMTPQQNLLSIGNMGKSSHDYVSTGQYFATKHGRDSSRFIAGGSSRGAMYSLAIAKAAPSHEAHVDYIDSISPCLPYGLVVSKLGAMASRLTKEPGRLIKMVTKHPHYTNVLAGTITTDLREQIQQLKELPALVSGATGQLAVRMPTDTFGYVQQYHDDGLAHVEDWPEVLSRFPLIRPSYDEGAHLDCVSPDTLAASIRRMEFVRDGFIAGAVGSVALHDMIVPGNSAFTGNTGQDRHLAIVA